jgi:hypothetical protein
MAAGCWPTCRAASWSTGSRWAVGCCPTPAPTASRAACWQQCTRCCRWEQAGSAGSGGAAMRLPLAISEAASATGLAGEQGTSVPVHPHGYAFWEHCLLSAACLHCSCQ